MSTSIKCQSVSCIREMNVVVYTNTLFYWLPYMNCIINNI